MIKKLSEVAIRSSFIYTRRNKRWENLKCKILWITLDDVLGTVGHSFTTVERNMSFFICNILCKYHFICE